ncbi:MAG: O-antigen ligase family protein [Acidobacteriia bacterium]|nr:O-antigen ligase family protein [Terriglobia bacterium]
MRYYPVLEYEWRGSPAVLGWRRDLDRWLAKSLYLCLIIFVLAAPHSIAVTQVAYSMAWLLWLMRWWLLGGVSPFPQRLGWPMLAFLVLSTISAAFSFAPLESWLEIKKVGLLFVAVLWSQTMTSVRLVKWISSLLIASCLVNVAYTGWQYTFGIGAQLRQVSPESKAARAGLLEDDSIALVGRYRVRDRGQLLCALAGPDLGSPIRLTVLRGTPRKKIRLDLDHAAVEELRQGITRDQVLVGRGHPLRAQGFYDHYVTYADVLVQIGLLAFSLFATYPGEKGWRKLLLGLAVLGMASALWLTLTRAAMASFLIGCLLVAYLTYRRRARLAMVGLVVIAVVVGGFLLHRNRGVGWLSLQSPEAQYRLLMWKDGFRLIQDYPWLGVGMGSLKTHWRDLHIEAYQMFPLKSHFHSSPIQIAVERGLLTLAAWLWLLAGYFRVLARLVRSTVKNDWYLRGITVGLVSSACAFLLGSLTDYNWGDSEVVTVLWMFLGWALALDRLVGRVNDQAQIAPAR